MEDKLSIVSFTDPACTWCWGSEPILRALETHFPGRFTIRNAMGGLMENFEERWNPKDGPIDVEALNKRIGKGILKASERHGMPVCGENYHLVSHEFPSTFPSCIAYEAAKIIAPERADQFLYEMKLATCCEGRVTNDENVLANVAQEYGMDVEALLKAFHGEQANKMFEDDMEFKDSIAVTVLPSFLLKYKDEQYLIRGYVDRDVFFDIIDRTSHGELKPQPVEATTEALVALMQHHPIMAAEEVRQAFDLSSQEEVASFVEPLLEDGTIHRKDAGNGWFVVLTDQVNSPQDLTDIDTTTYDDSSITTLDSNIYCNPETGVCTIPQRDV